MVVVVGGGVIGLCAALYAARAGCRVVLLERGGPTSDSCSLGNAGMVVPSHVIPLAAPGMVAAGLRLLADPEGAFALRLSAGPELWAWLWRFHRAATAAHVARAAPLLARLNLEGRAGFQELAAETDNAFGLTERGIVMVCRTEAALAEEGRLARLAEAQGVPAQMLDARELAALDPACPLAGVGGVLFPRDCHLAPEALVATLRTLATRAGVEIRWESPVTDWRVRSGRLVAARTPGGDVAADDFVLAAGTATGRLARGLGLRLPLQGGKGYSITLPAPPRLPRLPAILVEARLAVTPMGAGLRFAGTMELGGREGEVEPGRVRGMRRAVPRYYPDLRESDLEGPPVWSGLRPCTPDGLPYLGRTQRHPNLIVATGHAMMGVSLAPITGKLVADLLTGAPPRVPLDLLRPER
jgi:D-amino-acid dehydrogenase